MLDLTGWARNFLNLLISKENCLPIFSVIAILREAGESISPLHLHTSSSNNGRGARLPPQACGPCALSTCLSISDRLGHWLSSMLYERSLEIERRLETVLRLVTSGSYSTPMLADELGVSIPTVSRQVQALRQRGHAIRSERTNDGWRYVLRGDSPDSGEIRRLGVGSAWSLVGSKAGSK